MQDMCRHSNKNANPTLQSPAFPVGKDCQKITPVGENKKDAAAAGEILFNCFQTHFPFGITEGGVRTQILILSPCSGQAGHRFEPDSQPGRV